MIEDSKRDQPRFKGTLHGVKTIIAEEGYRGIYRGLGPVVCPLYLPAPHFTSRHHCDDADADADTDDHFFARC